MKYVISFVSVFLLGGGIVYASTLFYPQKQVDSVQLVNSQFDELAVTVLKFTEASSTCYIASRFNNLSISCTN